MALVRWDPARELDALQGDVNRLFDSFFGRRDGTALNGYGPRRWIPAMDVVETEDDLVLRADLPGLDRDDVEIEVKDGVLTISGERRAQHEIRSRDEQRTIDGSLEDRTEERRGSEERELAAAGAGS